MATAQACAALVEVVPDVLRLKRTLATAPAAAGAATLAAVVELGSPRVSELAEHLHLDMSTVSRQVTHLRERHLLRAYPHPLDGRAQQLSVTAEGVAELHRSRRALVGELAVRLADWDDADVESLAHLLARLSREGAPGHQAAHEPEQQPAPHRRAQQPIRQPIRRSATAPHGTTPQTTGPVLPGQPATTSQENA